MGTTRRAGLAAAALLVGLLGAGCAGDPRPYPPTGVDQLVIPTPSPQPSDFVATVDNAWFPVVPGTRWVYDGPGGRVARTVVATTGPVVAGVRTSALRTTVPLSAGQSLTTTDYYAQDRAGNVWWFGRAGQWRVGGTIGAGLAMPAHPRRGDGFVMAAAGGFDVRGVTVDTARRWQGTLGSTRRAVVLEVVRDGVAEVETFAPGLGMVRDGETGLVAIHQPRS
ncbi:MAG: hypothetical protein FWD95_04240 [Nocardioidaceae bacterium]|nr:hypothetical protein [Nocardioidaceae bacterium]